MGKTQLDREIYEINVKSNQALATMMREQYSPQYWVCFTFRYGKREQDAIEDVRHHLTLVARRIKRHIFAWGRFDNQPTRGSDGKSYIHFHMFLEFEKRETKRNRLFFKIIEEQIKINWKGDCDVRRYDSNLGGIEYSINKHRGHIEFVSCPRCQRKCNRNGRVCVYKKDAKAFINRNRFTRR